MAKKDGGLDWDKIRREYREKAAASSDPRDRAALEGPDPFKQFYRDQAERQKTRPKQSERVPGDRRHIRDDDPRRKYDRGKVVRLYKEGHRVREIALEMGAAINTIQTILEREGVYMPGRDRKGSNAGRRKTHCLRGHEYTEENTITIARNGYTIRECRRCKYDRNKKYKEKINGSE